VVEGDPRLDIHEVLARSAVVLEELLELRGEIAVSVVTGRDGSRVVYPPVDTEQRDGMCVTVRAPSQLRESERAAATDLALRVADLVGAVGVLAIELFVTDDGLLVNEVATRPHNSGHWSIEGATTSQFENHLRAVAGLPLGSTDPTAPLSVMVNVVGGSHEPRWNDLAALPGAYVHHYGKAFRPGRKLGHVTVTGLSPEETDEIVSTITAVLAN
jgi:5-(carboxyamino)imidazole ribonucleotide synthase